MIQILCTILTFVGAVVLLGLNQWFTARQKQTDTLSVKLEELYAILERIVSLGIPERKPSKSSGDPVKDMSENARDALKECKHAGLLIALYFPQLGGRWEEIWHSAEGGLLEMVDFDGVHHFDYIWEKVTYATHDIGKLLNHLTLESGSLTRRLFG